MTMQSYFWSGTGRDDIDALAQLVRNRPRPSAHVVVAHEHAVSVRAHGSRSGIWMRAIAFTRNQNSVPAAPITATVTSTAARLLAINSSTEKSTMANASR